MTILRLRADHIHRFHNRLAIVNDRSVITMNALSSLMATILCIPALTSNPFRSNLVQTIHRQRYPHALTTTKPIATFCQCKKRKRSMTGCPQKSLCTRTHLEFVNKTNKTYFLLFFRFSFRISDKIKFSQIKELENHVEDIVNQRQENAKKAYAEWLEKKRNAAAKAAINRCESVTMTEPEVKTFVKDCPPHLAWLKKKNKIEQAKKQLMSSNQKAEESEKNNQKQISIEMYNKWLVQAKQRNKPVPFGQGLLSTTNFSLATLSEIFTKSAT